MRWTSSRVSLDAFPPQACLLERAEEQRERRSKLVADVVEEHRLRAVELGKLVEATLLGFEGSGIGQRARHLAGGEREKGAIPTVEDETGRQPEHEVSGRASARDRERRHRGALDGLGVGAGGDDSPEPCEVDHP